MSELSKHVVVLTMLTNDAMDSARSLLDLAGLAKNDAQVSSAASAGVVAAIAHLARASEMGLIGILANKEAEDGGDPKLSRLKDRLRLSLEGTLRLLTKEALGSDVEFDKRRPMAGALVKAIKLRNRLIHHPGEYRIGNLQEIGGEIIDSHARISVPVPRNEWREVSPEYARAVVEVVEAFLESVMVERQEGSPVDRRFFSLVRVRRGAVGRPQGHTATR